MGLRGRGELVNRLLGENYILRSFMVCTPHQIIQGPPKKCIHTLTDGIYVLFSKLN
jgi:hypothetical protein